MKKAMTSHKLQALSLNRETLHLLEAPDLAAAAGGLSVGCHKWTTPSCVGTC